METFKSPTTMKNGNYSLTPAKLSSANSCICNYHNAMHTQKWLKRYHISQTFSIISVLTHIRTLAKCCICIMPVHVLRPCHSTGLIKHHPSPKKTARRRLKLRRTNIILTSHQLCHQKAGQTALLLYQNTRVPTCLIQAGNILYFDSIKCKV